MRRALFWSGVLLGGAISATAAIVYASAQSPDARAAWAIAKRVPLNSLSRVAGEVSTWHIPPALRRPIYSAYAAVYGCDLNEAERPVLEYATLQEFFARRLAPGARVIATNGLASPVDGTVLHFGVVGPDHSLEQVKGSPFTLESFIGPHELAKGATPADSTADGHHLYFCTIYLAPGDYHGVHAPVSMTIDGRRHFPGLLLPVSPLVVSVLQGLFSLNERIVLFGRWQHGFFSLTPVGATNVGSIALKLEPDVITNNVAPLRQPFYDRVYNDEQHAGRHVQAGDEMAFFRLGSTVVMIFESPQFRFIVEPGQKVKLGQLVGFPQWPPKQQQQQLQQQKQQ